MKRLGLSGFSCYPVKNTTDAVFCLIDMVKERAELDKKRFDRKSKKVTRSKYGYAGVRKHKNKWLAMIKKDGKQIYLGIFEKIEDANKKYLEALFEYELYEVDPIEEWNDSWIFEKVTQYYDEGKQPRIESAFHDQDKSLDMILVNM